jgi:hypothetical protein
MPARKRRVLSRRKLQKKRPVSFKKKLLYFLLLPFLLVLGLILFTSDCLKGSTKLSLASITESGDIYIDNFDPEAKEIITLVVPANTQLEVSRQLGTWKAGSLWKLGESQHYGGKLIQESILKNFYFPVNAWGEGRAHGLVSRNITGFLKAVFMPYKSSLKIADRLKVAFFSMGVKDYKRKEINLKDTPFLKKMRLIDGELGYVVTEGRMEELLIYFSDAKIAKEGRKVKIDDRTNRYGLAENVGKTIEIVGAKVAVITKGNKEAGDCQVYGKDPTLNQKIVEIFACKEIKKDSGGFDSVIILGEEFAKRY